MTNALTIITAETLEVSIAENLANFTEAARGAYAKSTERALRDDVAKFVLFCSAHGLQPLPASPKTIVAFVEEQIRLGRKLTSIRRYLSSLSTYHRAAEVPNPMESQTVKLCLRRSARELGSASKQAAPLNRPQVEQMLRAPGEGLRAMRDRALLAVAYDTGCRESETSAFQLSDLSFAPDGSGTVLVRRSKTDPEGKGMIRYLHGDTCELLRAWLSAAGHTDGALFRSVPKGGRLGGQLSPPEIARIIWKFARRAGVDPKGISGHSTRIGLAQDMVAAGIELGSIMQACGWSGPAMISRYSARLQAKRSGSAKLAVFQNR